MARVNKTEKNLQLVWDQLDDACGSLDSALDNLSRMSNISKDLKDAIDYIDVSAIVNLKNEVEELMKKSKG